MKNLKNRKKQSGLSMIEIGLGMAMMALIATFLIGGLLKKQQDVKYNTTLQLLQKDFPSAIVSQIARTNRCTSTNITRDNLIKRGLPEQTVWFEDWSVSVDKNNVVVTYPLQSDDSATGADLKLALEENPSVVSVVAPSGGVGDLVVSYRCN